MPGEDARSPSQLVLLGPPGAGKGTQAEKLADHFKLPHISTGEILRQEVSRRTELGERARAFMDRGNLVPDDIILDIVRSRLQAEDCRRGFILDGFPRSVPQAAGLEGCNGVSKRGLRVVSFEVPTAELVERMSRRGREDDREEVIRARLDVYRKETAPVLEYYRTRDTLIPIDGVGTTDEVFQRVVDALGCAA